MLVLLLFILRTYCILVVTIAAPAALVTLLVQVPLTAPVCAKLVLASCVVAGVLAYYELKRTEFFIVLDNLRISRATPLLAVGCAIMSVAMAFFVWLLPRH